MGEKLKILIVGLGSIGRRHAQVLKSLGGCDVAAFRTGKGTLANDEGLTSVNTLERALAFRPNGVIIANPTSLHVDSALPFLKTGVKVLIEKPVDNAMEKALLLKPFRDQLKIAYCLRFLPIINELHAIFKRTPPFKISFKRSFYLPKWHPYADYRKEYTAKNELGGGVTRTLSHELDLACHWFGKPVSVTGLNDRLSPLEIDTDDFAFYSLKMASGARVNFELDFFSPVNINQGEAFTTTGVYRWNMNGIWFTPYEQGAESQIYTSNPDAIDLMYRSQMQDFLDFIKGGDSLNASFEDGMNVLEIISHVEKR